MAGYLFGLGDVLSPEEYASAGSYSTIMSSPNGIWRLHHEATFADYASMKPGDNVYFFTKRKIYGVGKLVAINGFDCKFSNYPGACEPVTQDYEVLQDSLLLDIGAESHAMRWVCTFEPDPYFFTEGLDMDDVLSSNPDAFKMLRAFSRLSFIKFGDEENQAFRDVILKFNEAAIDSPQPGVNVFPDLSAVSHRSFSEKLGESYRLDVRPIMSTCSDGEQLRHEMAVEAGLIYQLSAGHPATTAIFGHWDYLSHQVIASPFKPLEYVDKIDCFGYRYIPNHKPTKSKFLVIELKKDEARIEDIEQVMKYVDWVKDEYCHNHYGMIEAFLVASWFSQEVIDAKREFAKRQYIIGRRPAKNLQWTNLKLVEYSYNEAGQSLDFELIE